jgi:hypothetical protein
MHGPVFSLACVRRNYSFLFFVSIMFINTSINHHHHFPLSSRSEEFQAHTPIQHAAKVQTKPHKNAENVDLTIKTSRSEISPTGQKQSK